MKINLPKHIEEIVSKQISSSDESQIEKYVISLLEDIFDVRKPETDSMTSKKEDEEVVAQRLKDLGYID